MDKIQGTQQICTKKPTVWRNVIFYCIVYIVIFALVFAISPLADDWYYSTAPNPNFTLSDLLPGSAFWRPFDVLFGGLMGCFPGLFPVLNRAVVVLAHILCAVFLDLILKEVEVKKIWRGFTVCFFLFSSAAWAVTISPDALNQAYSVLFGLIAIYVHLKKGGWHYLLFCAIALLWKESGVSWFFVIPIFDAVLRGKTWRGFIKDTKLVKQCLVEVLMSLVVVGVYFAIRFFLQGSVALGNGSSRYSVSILSFSTVKNFVLLFASAASGVDSVALLGKDRSLLLVAITGLLSMVFLLIWTISAIQMLVKKKAVFPLFGLIVCALGLAAPLAVIGQSGEMHAYPVLCVMAIIFGFCLDSVQLGKKKTVVAIVCIFLAFAISSVHKLTTVYDFSERTQTLTQNLKKQYDDPSGSVLFVEVGAWEGYSVFDQTALEGTSDGLSMRPYFGWQKLHHTQCPVKDEAAAMTYIQQNRDAFDHIFIIQDENVKKIK